MASCGHPTPARRRTHRLLPGAVTPALSVLLVACGAPGARPSATATPHPATTTTASAATGALRCLPAVGSLLGREVGGAVRPTVRVDTPGVLTCAYGARTTAVRVCGSVRIIVDTDPQPYADFERWEVETGQEVTQTGKHDPAMYPVLVGGIGIAADWVLATHQLDAVDATRWVRIFLTCPPGVSGLRQAESLIRVALVSPLG